MAIPFKVAGAGNNSTAQNVYKVTFSQALSAPPIYKAWDNSQTFPAVDSAGSTTNKEIFTGTTGNGNKPMLSLVDTSTSAPSSSWKPTSAISGSANPNRLKGSLNYVTATVTPTAGGSIRFNICLEVPYDATVPSTSSTGAMLEITYYYTGSTPTVTWYANEGTEGTPIWTSLTPGTHGIRFCWADVNPNDTSTWKLRLPVSGTIDDGAQIVST
ncbi:MAG: hypothetical protein QW076_00325 [Candidatus Anstonellales archaeon]